MLRGTEVENLVMAHVWLLLLRQNCMRKSFEWFKSKIEDDQLLPSHGLFTPNLLWPRYDQLESVSYFWQINFCTFHAIFLISLS